MYPHASILVLCEPVRIDPHCDYIKSIVAELSDTKIWYDELDVTLDRQKDYGCQDHPNESGHKNIADVLEPIVRKALNW